MSLKKEAMRSGGRWSLLATAECSCELKGEWKSLLIFSLKASLILSLEALLIFSLENACARLDRPDAVVAQRCSEGGGGGGRLARQQLAHERHLRAEARVCLRELAPYRPGAEHQQALGKLLHLWRGEHAYAEGRKQARRRRIRNINMTTLRIDKQARHRQGRERENREGDPNAQP
eukprot:1105653-Pleurochrysis_carterae.AAC.1